jgi:hypothetical protein
MGEVTSVNLIKILRVSIFKYESNLPGWLAVNFTHLSSVSLLVERLLIVSKKVFGYRSLCTAFMVSAVETAQLILLFVYFDSSKCRSGQLILSAELHVKHGSSFPANTKILLRLEF